MAGRAIVRTLGCRLNQAESDEVVVALAHRGVRVVEADPDVVVINTCSVTAEAASASRKLIRRSVNEFPEAALFVTGCYAAERQDTIRGMAGVDEVVVSKEGLVHKVAETGRPAEVHFPGPRRNLRVQTGCDEQCTFCIVPLTRGAPSSRPHSEVLEYARRLIDTGTREVTLTGVHLGTYGRDGSLPALLRDLAALKGLERIRLSSIEASHVDRALLETISSEPRLCRHLHLPLQTGDRRLWTAMRRPGTLDRFMEVAERARSIIPGIAITTDVMVGFPGEDEASFSATVDVVERVGFEKLHVFRFSPRECTPAASFPGQVDADVKRERSRTLRAAGDALRRRWLEGHVGHTVEVLVEQETPAGILRGYTDTYAPVVFTGPSGSVGEVVTVLVTSLTKGALGGRVPVLQDR
jgi:threonylcarbamoyladenosine tRNA methylthiotransferase MtaB